MPTETARVLRRLAREEASRRPEEKISGEGETKETSDAEKRFHALLCASVRELAALYTPGLIPERGIPAGAREAEERMNAAARAGDFEEAERALHEWEEAWRKAFHVPGGNRGTKENG